MINLLNVVLENVSIDGSFIPQTRTYNVVTSYMSDQCRPFRVASCAMLWVTETGYVGEIECIYPELVDNPLCDYSDDPCHEMGFPKLEVTSCDNEVYIQHNDKDFTIWFNKNKMIDKTVNCNDFLFLVSGNELVAIKTKTWNVVE